VEREYDLFEQLNDGSPMWRGHASGLHEVRRQLAELSKVTKNECFAMHLPTKEIVARANVRTTEGRKPLLFQITYHPDLAKARSEVLRLHGYEVVTVFGNEAAEVVLSMPQDYDLFVVGHAAPDETRREMVEWLKANHPDVPIIALNPPSVQQLLGADYNLKLNGPETLLPILGTALGRGQGGTSATS
jgi:CheY-like chemotaxis protein